MARAPGGAFFRFVVVGIEPLCETSFAEFTLIVRRISGLTRIGAALGRLAAASARTTATRPTLLPVFAFPAFFTTGSIETGSEPIVFCGLRTQFFVRVGWVGALTSGALPCPSSPSPTPPAPATPSLGLVAGLSRLITLAIFRETLGVSINVSYIDPFTKRRSRLREWRLLSPLFIDRFSGDLIGLSGAGAEPRGYAGEQRIECAARGLTGHSTRLILCFHIVGRILVWGFVDFPKSGVHRFAHLGFGSPRVNRSNALFGRLVVGFGEAQERLLLFGRLFDLFGLFNHRVRAGSERLLNGAGFAITKIKVFINVLRRPEDRLALFHNRSLDPQLVGQLGPVAVGGLHRSRFRRRFHRHSLRLGQRIRRLVALKSIRSWLGAQLTEKVVPARFVSLVLHTTQA